MRLRGSLPTRIISLFIPERIPWFAARLYDRIAGGAISSYYKEVTKEIVAHITHGRILDIGTGPGHLPIEIAKAAPGVEIVGVDLSKKMIEIARKNTTAAGMTARLQFFTGDGNRLDFNDNTYDMVISSGSLHAWKDPVRVINECYRVLKPACEAWIFDPARIFTPESQKVLDKRLNWIDRLAYWWGSFSSKVTIPLTEDEVQEIIAATLFRHGTVEYTKWFKITLRKEL